MNIASVWLHQFQMVNGNATKFNGTYMTMMEINLQDLVGEHYSTNEAHIRTGGRMTKHSYSYYDENKMDVDELKSISPQNRNF